MNASARICGLTFGSITLTGVYEVAAYAGAHAAGLAAPPALIIAAGGFPQVIAAGFAVAILAGRNRTQQAASPAQALLPGQVRRPLTAPARKELVR